MSFTSSKLYTFMTLSLLYMLGTATPRYCKPGPSSSNWPSGSDWHTLNASVSGRLTLPTVAGAVCHPNLAQFNNMSCHAVTTEWTNSSYHAALNPNSVDYNDETCLPYAIAPCSAAGYPAYVVEAVNGEDVQKAVDFARNTGIRLVIKGTGHDWPGRSSGPGSLSIWTHKIRGVEVTHQDQRAVAQGGVASVKIAAGMRMFELYAEAAKSNITVVGGADANVGIGGWITGAGHSPLSSRYGLGADQVLEMEVVTADGEFRTINTKKNSELFWAIRGGGGSTFAVMVSVTVKAYPALAFSDYIFSYSTTANSNAFWNLATYFHTQLPKLAESGVMGYYYVRPDTGTAEPDPAIRGKVQGEWLVPERTAAQASAILAPIEQYMRNAQWSDKVGVSSIVTEVPDFSAAWAERSAESVGGSGRLGSRLLDGPALTGNFTKLKAALKTATASSELLLGHLVAGPGVHNAVVPGGNAVLPAWRKAYTHIIAPTAWPPLNSTAKSYATTQLRDVRVQALRDLAPDSGAYMNEADPTEPNHQRAFWGAQYERLLNAKRYWDPQGVFWCSFCVGSEDWVFVAAEAGGLGIAQDGGRICKNT